MKTYVTFGHDHRHVINGKVFDKNNVAVIESESSNEGRNAAFRYFGNKFCFEYPENHWDDSKMNYFPNGYLEITEQDYIYHTNIYVKIEDVVLYTDGVVMVYDSYGEQMHSTAELLNNRNNQHELKNLLNKIEIDCPKFFICKYGNWRNEISKHEFYTLVKVSQ